MVKSSCSFLALDLVIGPSMLGASFGVASKDGPPSVLQAGAGIPWLGFLACDFGLVFGWDLTRRTRSFY